VVRVGVISDTHGLLRPQALDALRGSDFIVHAGDVGDAAIVAALAMLAPVTVVRGNNDRGAAGEAWPEAALLVAAGVRIHVLHDLKCLAVDPVQQRYDVIVSGHSHKPRIARERGVLYLNPGSAGPRRFTLPVSVATLDIARSGVEPRILELPV